jgi:hypothetical protein
MSNGYKVLPYRILLMNDKMYIESINCVDGKVEAAPISVDYDNKISLEDK